ncbi:MAG: hypothetical protein HYY17_01455 [Planctomycetes bacterium]|nr:hypothetical protein [Planctomycetota bacterium]
MAVRLVRCPYCGKRFDVSGVPSGTRLRCASCTAILAVPREVRPAAAARPGQLRRAGMQVGAALVVSAALASGLYFLLRSGSRSEPGPIAALPPAQPKPESKKNAPANHPVFIDWNDRLTQSKLRLREEFGFDRIRFKDDGRPFLVAVERGERYSADVVIKEYASRLTELHDFFRREFASAVELPEIDEVLAVVVLSSRESYDAYTRRVNDGEEHSPQIRGVYEFTRGRIVTYHDPMAPFEVILHEGVHQLVHCYTKRLGREGSASTTQWFQEGLGTYFEGFRRTGDGQIFLDPEVNRLRLPAVKQAILDQKRTFTPLAVLTGMTIDGFWSWYREQRRADDLMATRLAQVFYAESWALVYFLRARGGNYRRAFDEYFRLELEGRGGKEGFERAIRTHLGKDLQELEKEFVDYIQQLE